MAPDRARPTIAIVIGCVLALVAVVVALAFLEIEQAASLDAARRNLANLVPFWCASGAAWAALTCLALDLRRRGGAALTGAGKHLLVIAVVALAARVAVVIVHDPALSDDLHRYVFDARNLASGENPYLVRPGDRAAGSGVNERWPGESAVASSVNNDELFTIYLPTSQWYLAAAERIMPGAPGDPVAAGRRVRFALVLAEMVAIVAIGLVLVRLERNPWWLALYAWHPLALTEIAGSGHQESIGLACLALALLAWTAWPRRAWQWTIPLAAGALVKPIVVPIAACMLAKQGWKKWAASLVVGVAVCALLAAPLFLGNDGAALDNLLDTSRRFSLKWAHFGVVYEPLLWTIERFTPEWTNDLQERLARAICTVLVIVALLFTVLRRLDPWSGGLVIFTSMVLFTPAAHPWYLLWALLLVPGRFSATVWTLSLTISLGYAAWRFAPDDKGELAWAVPAWVMWAAYVPVGLGLAWDVVRCRRGGDGAIAA